MIGFDVCMFNFVNSILSEKLLPLTHTRTKLCKLKVIVNKLTQLQNMSHLSLSKPQTKQGHIINAHNNPTIGYSN